MIDPTDIIILIAHLFFAFGFLGLCLYFKRHIPKSINSWYGYRTTTSMKSQATWDEANRYSAQIMLYVAYIYCALTVISYFTIKGLESFQFCGVALVIMPLSTIVFTELHLNKKFDKEGKTKSITK